MGVFYIMDYMGLFYIQNYMGLFYIRDFFFISIFLFELGTDCFT